jgi:hypothetical protein
MAPVIHYEIEELIPASRSVSRRAYWTNLNGDEPVPYREAEAGAALRAFDELTKSGRRVRLVRVMRELVAGPRD